MTDTVSAPLFSIVLATRDRATLFAAALQSVATQTFADTEIIVVDDGSGAAQLPAYEQVLAQAAATLGPRLRTFRLVHRPRGHGQSYSLNYGVDQARGEYVCFLDDDDAWIDSGHLQRAAAIIAAERDAGRSSGRAPDLLMTNQEAWRGDVKLPGPTWIEGLEGQLRARGAAPQPHGGWRIAIEDLLGCGGFCHLNCLMVRRELWRSIGGMDEGIRWECDRDVFLRLIDVATHIVHHPATTSRHHVPDPKAGTSMTTQLNQIERRMWQLRVLDKAALNLKSPLLRAHGRTHKGYALKRIAEVLAAQGAWTSASAYAAQGLGALPGIKWLLFTLSCWARRLLHPRSP